MPSHFSRVITSCMHDHKCIGNSNYRDLTSTNKAVQNADLTLKQKQYTLLINNVRVYQVVNFTTVKLSVIILLYTYVHVHAQLVQLYMCVCLGSTI